MPPRGIESYRFGIVFACPALLQRSVHMLRLFDPSTQGAQAPCSGAQKLASLFFVPPRGIEPRLQDPQSCVLSVERRGHMIIPKHKAQNSKRAIKQD